MGFRKFGFGAVGNMINNLRNDIENIQHEELRQLGLKAEQKAVLHLRNQDLNWQRLSDVYLRRKNNKKGKRLSEKTLIATGSYLQSITSWATKDAVFVGVKRNVKNNEGEDIANIAMIHEYGSTARNIPARPLWGPVMNEMQGDGALRINLTTAFLRYFKRKYNF